MTRRGKEKEDYEEIKGDKGKVTRSKEGKETVERRKHVEVKNTYVR